MLRIFACLATLIPIIAAAQPRLDPDETVLTINGETIRASEYYRRMEYLPGVGRNIGGQFAEAPPGILTLLRLIDERLLLQVARERNCYPSPQEVQEELSVRLAENPKLLESLAALGLTRSDYEYRLLLELAEFKLQTFGITITDQEVERHYEENPTRFTIPRGYHLRVIAVTTPADREAVDQALAGGEDFAEVAKRYSKDPSRSNGGDLGILPAGSLSEQARREIEAIRIGQHTAWIEVEGTSVKFYLQDVVPETKQPLDAALRRNLRRALMLDRGKVRNDLVKMLNEARQKAVVSTARPEFEQAIRSYLRGTP